MSQNDFNIANQGFPSFRSDLNDALQALASNSAGDTEPSTMYAYQWWYDSTADALKIRNADNNAWITFATFDQTTDTWSLASLTLNRLTSDGTILDLRKDGSTVGVIGAGGGSDMYHGSNDTGLKYYNAGDAIHPYNPSSLANRDNAIDLGMSNTRFKDLYLSGGVYLGGTGSANYLDDYEEGTWTPHLNTLSNATYNLKTGRYTKIGNMVYCDGAIILTSKGTLSGGLSVNGLPYTVVSYTTGSLLATGATSIAWWNGTTGVSALSIAPSSNETFATLRAKATGNSTLDTVLDTSDITDSFSVRFNFVYRIA